ncbi:MAG: hypothetical protein A2655_01945 [Candidatus Yanofskybacteria bacterium RIFCSPHIGHO2_01_FULL_43_42]|uniref:Uncharacterized protein n=1 Tax=Candidatus Yanofskybacteria bacterium RIFCSPLOWO2_01_FULL_43_22 TaxID=1802695 RepID=A0A1F8GGX7_9BACT|nr:MAG: hypothetical protein A2655_01945 [Candidatus Yanofskybacteria bacterium RIFCSPHIGHO2_01_FULL_43_42]OGN13232.1 MAG: hypothetical protein A3D48_02850 [Candidatus Yanofskybacteria bacterium RIFCSPHIGHO2_02_FULL_43_17]OGN24647.1 MAG: hypothetical protein A3A13_01075 [Candidatus Yanofskybacteria bacterium RIFCSPLOWO2_01_FULL_43_22]
MSIDQGNVFKVKIPFGLLRGENNSSRANRVIFWGADFKFLPPGIPEDKFIELSNACIDYVRKNCKGCALIYKLHPAETDEYTKLNLDGFKIVGTDDIGEFFLLKNINNIKYTFSAISGACVSAHKMGIPSFIFLELFEPLFLPETKTGYREYFSPLPKESLISNLNDEFQDYKIATDIDEVLNNNLRELFKNSSKKVFFIADTPGVLAEIITLSNLIKNISPQLEMGLIVCRHHRWDVMKMDDLKPYFDSINIFPRTFYSLRPGKLFRALKIAWSIRRFPIGDDDILVGMTHTSLVEVCFMSYHKQAKRIAVLSEVSFDTVYGEKSKDMLNKIKYRTPPASRFYNLFLESLLGLYRTIYMDDPGKVMNFRRYQKHISEIYDQVYLF